VPFQNKNNQLLQLLPVARQKDFPVVSHCLKLHAQHFLFKRAPHLHFQSIIMNSVLSSVAPGIHHEGE